MKVLIWESDLEDDSKGVIFWGNEYDDTDLSEDQIRLLEDKVFDLWLEEKYIINDIPLIKDNMDENNEPISRVLEFDVNIEDLNQENKG